MPEPVAPAVVAQLTQALALCHSRDLKPDRRQRPPQ
ncbi:hypothetical protein ACP4OV_007246 [Aristida adscensionis]